MVLRGIDNKDNSTIENISTTNIQESFLRETMPEILDILLIDRTTSTTRTKNNIIWANENYIQHGFKYYSAKSQMKPNLITGERGQLIKPRALKSRELQKERTKSKAEVFTPTWVVKKQNDEVDKDYQNDNLETYVKRTWIEITCGEAPYMTTRYDMETGDIIPFEERVGFVDRKLKRINSEVEDKAEWQRLVEEAFKSSYGFEWSGDSLLLARENLLYTYRDYYYAKWSEEPLYGLFEDIAEIISYNVFQMDGLKYIIPLSEKKEKIIYQQLSLFDGESEEQWVIKPGRRVKIMNWKTNRMEFFDKGVK
ncbi:restriction endonuclease [Ligilactobacillus murinus]|uniref:Restriction endonuclease n=2 Tax=Ligilactobacillus murinus TaxID=1622 RepID=A0AAE6WHQ6_9LACO|nr:restriction endonuclease [Ligilactobacillus murinus]NEF82625.1 restriction endonuclease [Ligilactobacillus murinus]NEF84899.1 restriction endonuclease [Ligilactobacillus murinus]NEF87207.1 restriction endonuclease [Ligilactobacillus murinus]NEF89562.1 restriction endonuclease [Ligilactobacillus murinus]NEF91793.1 restriction endonuclease [Ligilactobacillus murinus]